MTGLTSETRELDAVTTPRDTTRAAAAAATAVEVAALREGLDGVATKLEEVDRRVDALETAATSGLDATDDGGSAPASTARAETIKPAPDATPTQKSVLSGEVSAVAPRANPDTSTTAEATGTPPTPAVPTPPSIVLMLSDHQFERWFGRDQTTPDAIANHDIEGRERRVDWSLRRNAPGRATARRR
jgi:hypothetical protein